MASRKFLVPANLLNLSSDPVSGIAGDIYFNTVSNKLKIYDGTVWSEVGTGGGGSTITVSETAPTSPEIGDEWYENTTGSLYIWDGTFWVEVNGVIGITQEEVQDYVAPLLTHQNHTNVVATYDDTNNQIILNTSGQLTNIDSIVSPDFITFDTTPELSSATPGTMFWDNGEGTPAVVLNSDVTLQIGQENITLCYNGTGSTIPNGSVVYISGAQGQKPSISLADADTEPTSSKVFGIATQDILNGGDGFVATFGTVNGLNTEGLTEGAALWLSSTPGQFTQTKPVAPVHTVFIGYVLNANASSGRVFVNPQNGYEIDELHDVLITNKQNDQALVYDSSTGLWKNQAIVNSVGVVENELAINVTSGTGDVILGLPINMIAPGSLTVTGDLTVNGTTTTVNTEQLVIEDNIITLNGNVTGTPTGTAGIEIERGTETNTSILWDETRQSWKFSNDIEAPIIRYNDILQLSVDTDTVNGQLLLNTLWSSLDLNTSGSINVSPGDNLGFVTYKFDKLGLQFPDLSTQSTAFLGMSSYDTDDLTEGTTNLYFTSTRVTDITDPLYDTSGAAASALTSANSYTDTEISALSSVYQPLDSDLTAISGLSTTYPNGGFLKFNGQSWEFDANTYLTTASAQSLYATQSSLSNYLTITDASNTYLSQINAALLYQPIGNYSLTSHNHTVDSLSNVVITTPADGQALIWDSATSKWVNENVVTDLSNYVTLTGTETLSNKTINNYLYFSSSGATGQGLISYNSQSELGLTSSGSVDITGYSSVSVFGSNSILLSSGGGEYLNSVDPGNQIAVINDLNLNQVTSGGAWTNSAIEITNTTQSTSPTTGALIVSGGVGIAKDVWIDGNLHVNGTTVTENTKTVATHDNLIYLNAAIDTTITNAVYSGGSITYTADNTYTAGMDIRITGIDPAGYNISSADGLTIASATSTSFTVVKADPGAAYVSGGTAHAKEEANPDLGFAGGYYSGGYAHAGLFRDATDGVFKFFQGYTPEPDEATNIDTTDPSFTLANISAANATFSNDIQLDGNLKFDVVDGISKGLIRVLSGPGYNQLQVYTPEELNLYSEGYTGIYSDDNIIISGTNGEFLKSSSSANQIATIGDLTIDTVTAGTPIAYQYGGTGLSTLGTAGQVLKVNSTETGLEWGEGGSAGGAAVYVSANPPATPEEGSTWFDNVTGRLYIYDGTFWQEANNNLTSEAVMDIIATMIGSGTHTNIDITYDDLNNKISFNVLSEPITDFLTLNENITGTPTGNAGIIVNRGDLTDVAIRFNETEDTWEYTNDGVEYQAIGSGGGAVSTMTALSNSFWLGA